MRRKLRKGFAAFLALFVLLACLAGCGGVNSSEITRMDRDAQKTAEEVVSSSSGGAETLERETELPADGVITQKQMESIAGKQGEYSFYATDKETGILYTWIYDGARIQNPVEQNLKVSFPQDKTEEVKKAADHASVGLGISLPKTNLAAPARLRLTLTEKWDADTVILVGMADGSPEKVTDVTVGETEKDGGKVTTLEFQVRKTGDVFYLVGGKSAAADSSSSSVSSSSGSAGSEKGSQGTAAGGSTQGSAAQGGTGTAGNTGAANNTEGSGGTDGTDGTGGSGSGNSGSAHTCTISIDCMTILNNMDNLKSTKTSFVPADGYILYASTVEYTPGETVYDLLYRICRDTGIQMEADYTPVYSSYYVRGINQLYEFDCGELSGWMYSVNGWFPNYGCSKYTISDGDVIQWRYTCDLGRDVGDQYYDN